LFRRRQRLFCTFTSLRTWKPSAVASSIPALVHLRHPCDPQRLRGLRVYGMPCTARSRRTERHRWTTTTGCRTGPPFEVDTRTSNPFPKQEIRRRGRPDKSQVF
jgi:hypothetical protein